MIWFLAPSHSASEFQSLFAQSIPLQSLSAATTAAYRRHQVIAVVQNAGDTLYLPGGWWHCVKNLTETVSLSGVYLRPWKLAAALDYSRRDPDPYGRFNFRSLMHVLRARTNLGLTPQEITELCRQWEELDQQLRPGDFESDLE